MQEEVIKEIEKLREDHYNLLRACHDAVAELIDLTEEMRSEAEGLSGSDPRVVEGARTILNAKADGAIAAFEVFKKHIASAM